MALAPLAAKVGGQALENFAHSQRACPSLAEIEGAPRARPWFSAGATGFGFNVTPRCWLNRLEFCIAVALGCSDQAAALLAQPL